MKHVLGIHRGIIITPPMCHSPGEIPPGGISKTPWPQKLKPWAES